MMREHVRESVPTTVLGTYVLRCKIQQQGDSFLATVTAIPDDDCPVGTPPESESRLLASREEAFRACADIGFAMEARLLKRGLRVRGWPPRRSETD